MDRPTLYATRARKGRHSPLRPGLAALRVEAAMTSHLNPGRSFACESRWGKHYTLHSSSARLLYTETLLLDGTRSLLRYLWRLGNARWEEKTNTYSVKQCGPVGREA